ncbi:hypothetical protein ACFX2I_019242 [Malus domestica]
MLTHACCTAPWCLQTCYSSSFPPFAFQPSGVKSTYTHWLHWCSSNCYLCWFSYVAITDIAWSPDAHCLALSSQDGYCTLVEFENDELGSPIYLIEEKKVVGDEKRSPVHKPEDMVNEAAKNDSPVEKAENVPTEAMAANNLITTDSGKSKAEWNQLTEAETKGKEVGGEENECPVEKAR